jgi:hypothetical protein
VIDIIENSFPYKMALKTKYISKGLQNCKNKCYDRGVKYDKDTKRKGIKIL